MADRNHTLDGGAIFDAASKYIAAVLAALYIIGFFVVSSHLSQYGVASFTILQLQYLIAGSWTLVPPFLHAFFMQARYRFEERAKPDLPRGFNWHRLWLSLFWGGLPFGFIFGIALAAGASWGLTWRVGAGFWLFSCAIGFCGRTTFASWTVPPERETQYVNRVAGPFYLTLLGSILFAYALWFGGTVYPLIPYAIGGGRPLTVAFLGGIKGLPEGLKAGGSITQSIDYELLMETDKDYVVISPNPREKSVEFARDSVEGMIVLDH